MSSFNIYDHASQKQIDQFKPTFLYIKQHSITGKLYFGKTVNKNIEDYKGSGVYWSNHLRKHGADYVITLWFCLFTEIESLVETAVSLSISQNIMESNDFANLVAENGLMGGITHSKDYVKSKEAKALTAMRYDAKIQRGYVNPLRGKIRGPLSPAGKLKAAITREKTKADNLAAGIIKQKRLTAGLEWTDARKALAKITREKTKADNLAAGIIKLPNKLKGYTWSKESLAKGAATRLANKISD